MILEHSLSISAPSSGFHISVPTWKQGSYRFTSPDGVQNTCKITEGSPGSCSQKKIRVGLPENTNSQFISWCLTTLFNKGLQGTATNLWVKKTEIAAFPKSEGILSGSLLLDCNMLCSSRAGNVSQAHENRLGLLTAHVHGTHKPLSATHSPSHPTAAPTQVRGKKNCGEKPVHKH